MIEEVSNVADAYAQGLLLAARDEDAVPKLLAAVTRLLEVLHAEPRFRVLLAAPHIRTRDKERVLSATLAGRVPDLLYHLVLLVVRRHRGMHLRDVLVRFRDLATEEVGRVPALVQSARPLSPGLKRRIEQTLEGLTKRDLDIQWVVDADLIGGIKVSFENMVMDATLRRGLKTLKAAVTDTEE